ncbi:hypothetical protein E3N88_27391 [Mikania micrantha]|uniref:PARP catalytic domain-containing protein n=1 Tax=Mikania micrantha TaxID=192012 RepID=A0A5N6MXM6_9ASTR|nr:hypothetical protein E3N88_27391 [Mikania micrantha]
MLVHHLHPNPIENSPSGYKARFVSQLHAKMRLHSTTCALTAVESQAARVMHAFCAFIRGNVNCQGKQTDVIPRNARTITLGNRRAQRRKLEEDEELTHLHTRNCSPGYAHQYTTTLRHFCKHPSSNHSFCCLTITNNPTSRRFTTASHPIFPSIVASPSGAAKTPAHHFTTTSNSSRLQPTYFARCPLLWFRRNQLLPVRLQTMLHLLVEVLLFPSLPIYLRPKTSIIKPDFYVPKKKRGIWLTRSCQDVITANANANAEMTIVVCRVISGRVKDLNDGDEDDYDSIEGAKPNYLFLAARVMHSFCAFLMNCQGKRTDVIRRNARSVMLGSRDQRRKLENDEELTHHHALNYPPGGTVLAIGDPSRNVIEMIFRSKSTNTPKYSINIKQVLKLNNSKQTLERFENFREIVKNQAHDHQNKHPRNVVDGNEKLMFYGTKLRHCKNIGTSMQCKDNIICSIIKPDFYVPKKKRGIWLTTSCQDVITANANAEMIKGEMTIVVCRVISGRVKDLNDGDEDDYDSIEGVKPNYLFVRDPSAVLPCFVVILKCWCFPYFF